MSIHQIVDRVRSFDGALVLAPAADSGYPELAWGDFFFYFAPDGQVPQNTQPYATIVTKNYPDDAESDLDSEGRWRVNVHVSATQLEQLTQRHHQDFAETDVFLPHPVYGALGWVSVVKPGERTLSTVLELLRIAHDDAHRRTERRAGIGQNGGSSSPAPGGG